MSESDSRWSESEVGKVVVEDLSMWIGKRANEVLGVTAGERAVNYTKGVGSE